MESLLLGRGSLRYNGRTADPAPGAEKPYYLARDQWERRTPAAQGMDAGLLDKAIAWAKTECAGGTQASLPASRLSSDTL